MRMSCPENTDEINIYSSVFLRGEGCFLRESTEGIPEAASGWLSQLLLVHVYNDYLLHGLKPTDALHGKHVYKCQCIAGW